MRREYYIKQNSSEDLTNLINAINEECAGNYLTFAPNKYDDSDYIYIFSKPAQNTIGAKVYLFKIDGTILAKSYFQIDNLSTNAAQATYVNTLGELCPECVIFGKGFGANRDQYLSKIYRNGNSLSYITSNKCVGSWSHVRRLLVYHTGVNGNLWTIFGNEPDGVYHGRGRHRFKQSDNDSYFYYSTIGVHVYETPLYVEDPTSDFSRIYGIRQYDSDYAEFKLYVTDPITTYTCPTISTSEGIGSSGFNGYCFCRPIFRNDLTLESVNKALLKVETVDNVTYYRHMSVDFFAGKLTTTTNCLKRGSDFWDSSIITDGEEYYGWSMTNKKYEKLQHVTR